MSIVGISADSAEDLQKHMAGKNIDFDLLADPELQVIDAFDLRHKNGNPFGGDIARPAVILLDEQRKVVFRILPDNWRVRPTPEMILEKVPG